MKVNGVTWRAEEFWLDPSGGRDQEQVLVLSPQDDPDLAGIPAAQREMALTIEGGQPASHVYPSHGNWLSVARRQALQRAFRTMSHGLRSEMLTLAAEIERNLEWLEPMDYRLGALRLYRPGRQGPDPAAGVAKSGGLSIELTARGYGSWDVWLGGRPQRGHEPVPTPREWRLDHLRPDRCSRRDRCANPSPGRCGPEGR
jgi:hypothetical protein